jgi:hypothetical protein
MFLIAPGAQALARWDDAERERKMGRQIRRGYFTEKFSPEAGHYEDDFSERIVSPCIRKQRRNKMATSKERDKEHGKGHLAMNAPPIVSQQEWEAARQQLLVKEKA